MCCSDKCSQSGTVFETTGQSSVLGDLSNATERVEVADHTLHILAFEQVDSREEILE